MTVTGLMIAAAVCLSAADALLDSEVSQFAAEVQLMKNDAETHYEFFSSGYPPHEIDNSVNPNTASVQNYSYTIPIAPNVTDDMVYCTSLGPVGFAKNGVAIYNALTGQTTDAVKNEVLDQCSGHASPGGAYHYHALSECVGGLEIVDDFIGFAIDGLPIYGPNASDKAELLRSADLDLCHGRYVNGLYRYHITLDFPYALGCYRAEPAASNNMPQGRGQGPPGNGQGPPGSGQGPPPGRKKRQNQEMVVCRNEDSAAQLCDCASGMTYRECDVATAQSTCSDSEDGDGNGNGDGNGDGDGEGDDEENGHPNGAGSNLQQILIVLHTLGLAVTAYFNL